MAKKKRRELNIGEDEWDSFIGKYVQRAKDERGFVAKVTKLLNDSGHPVKAQQVYQWLAEDNRVQPKAGAAIVLMRHLPTMS